MSIQKDDPESRILTPTYRIVPENRDHFHTTHLAYLLIYFIRENLLDQLVFNLINITIHEHGAEILFEKRCSSNFPEMNSLRSCA